MPRLVVHVSFTQKVFGRVPFHVCRPKDPEGRHVFRLLLRLAKRRIQGLGYQGAGVCERRADDQATVGIFQMQANAALAYPPPYPDRCSRHVRV